MPTYDYECQQCGHTCEVFQSISEEPRRKCPECGKNRFKRLIGAGAGVLFRGSGFYETDYRSDSYKAKAKADTESGGPDKSSGSDGKKASETKTSGGKASDTKASDTKAPGKAASGKD